MALLPEESSIATSARQHFRNNATLLTRLEFASTQYTLHALPPTFSASPKQMAGRPRANPCTTVRRKLRKLGMVQSDCPHC